MTALDSALDSMMPADVAALLLGSLEAQGAIVRLQGAEDYMFADLNPIPGMTVERADALSRSILRLRDELRAILRARRVTH